MLLDWLHERHPLLLPFLLVAITVVAASAAVHLMTPEQFAFWFGKTVNHCPDSEFSCPSTQPGVFMGVAYVGAGVFLVGGLMGWWDID